MKFNNIVLVLGIIILSLAFIGCQQTIEEVEINTSNEDSVEIEEELPIDSTYNEAEEEIVIEEPITQPEEEAVEVDQTPQELPDQSEGVVQQGDTIIYGEAEVAESESETIFYSKEYTQDDILLEKGVRKTITHDGKQFRVQLLSIQTDPPSAGLQANGQYESALLGYAVEPGDIRLRLTSIDADANTATVQIVE